MRDRQIYREFEKKLRPFSLDDHSINGSTERQELIFPHDAAETIPLRSVQHDVQLAERHGLPWQTCHNIPFMAHYRYVPHWINSDVKLRELIRHRFPGAFLGRVMPSRREQQRQSRQRAGELAAVLYLAYRMLLPFETVAEELDIETDRAVRIANDGRAHGDLFFAGKYCCQFSPHEAA